MRHLASTLLTLVMALAPSGATLGRPPAPTTDLAQAAFDKTRAESPAVKTASSIRFDEPLVVRVVLRSTTEVDSDGGPTGIQLEAPTLDWTELAVRLQATSPQAASGIRRPLAFLIECGGSTTPFDAVPEAITKTLELDSSLDVSKVYGNHLAKTIEQLLDTARRQIPEAALSIVGLPVERVTPTGRIIDDALSAATSQLDVLVSSRTLIRPGSDVAASALESALPSATARASGRLVFYRTPRGWFSWTPTLGDLGNEPDASPRETEFAAADAEPAESIGDDGLVLDSKATAHPDPDATLAFSEIDAHTDREGSGNTDSRAFGNTPVDTSGDERPDRSRSEGVGVNSREDTDPDASSEFESDPWFMGDPELEGSEVAEPATDSASSVKNPEDRGAMVGGNRVTVPRSVGSPAFFPHFGAMGLDVGDDIALSDLLKRLADSNNARSNSPISRVNGVGSGSRAGVRSAPRQLGGIGTGETSIASTPNASAVATSADAPSPVIPPFAAPADRDLSVGSTDSSSVDGGSSSTIVIPIAPTAPTTPPPSPNPNNTPIVAPPDSPIWNPGSGIDPTTPLSGNDATTSPAAVAAGSPYRFGTTTDDLVWGYWACSPFTTADGRLWIGVAAHAFDDISSVRFIVTELGATSVPEPEYHPDRSLDAYWISIRPQDISANQVAITAIVHAAGTVEPLESTALVVTKDNNVWNTQSFRNGWTELVPSADSKLVYVATDGDDAAAAAAKGRGYYLPSDPEIGPDPMNPVGPIAAYATINAARGVWGGSGTIKGPSLINAPDWCLFKRGQTFDMTQVDDPWQNGLRCDVPIYGMSGRSKSEPFVVTAWGDSSAARPHLTNAAVSALKIDTFWQSIEFSRGVTSKPYDWGTFASGTTFEDCRFNRGFGALYAWPYDDITIRRCVIVDSFNPDGHNSGMFVAVLPNAPEGYNNPTVLIEECIVDRNGYKEDPNEPTTWTFGKGGDDTRPYGEGLQPRRTYFDRNLYLSSYGSMTIRGNIISRGGGGSDVQMRSGGVCDRNLFLMNSQGILMGSRQDTPAFHDHGLVIDNVFLHDEHFVPSGGSTNAISAVWYSKDLIIRDNIVARYMRSLGTTAPLQIAGKDYANDSQPASPARFIGVTDNEFDIDGGKYVVSVVNATSTDILDLAITNNSIWKGSQLDNNPNFRPWIGISGFSDPSGNTSDEPWEWANNDYASAVPGANFRLVSADVSLNEWQSAGFDVGSTLHADRAALAAAAGWTDPDRSILTYMQAVDPTYVVNEDVYVDDGASGQKQAVRQKVWETIGEGFDEATRKLIARNYHAFLTFIERARNNRKGAWDSRWTADAVNNYIREGFGEPPVAWGRD